MHKSDIEKYQLHIERIKTRKLTENVWCDEMRCDCVRGWCCRQQLFITNETDKNEANSVIRVFS